MICQSAFASPGGSCAFLHFWTRRSVEVWVPSFSAKQAAGKNNIGELCGLGQEDILHDHELGVL